MQVLHLPRANTYLAHATGMQCKVQKLLNKKQRQNTNTTEIADVKRTCVQNIVVGGRHFWLFVLAGDPPYILYTYLIYHLYILGIYTTIYMFGGPPATSKTRPPTTMVQNIDPSARLGLTPRNDTRKKWSSLSSVFSVFQPISR